MYTIVGIHFGKDIKKKVVMQCLNMYNRVYVADICESKETYFDILDTKDMTIERLHILQLNELLKKNPSLYDEVYVWNPMLAQTYGVGVRRAYELLIRNRSNNTLLYLGLPYRGEVYYKVSDCKKYVASCSLYTDMREDEFEEDDYDERFYYDPWYMLFVGVLAYNFDGTVADDAVEFYAEECVTTTKLESFSFSADNDSQRFSFKFNDKDQDCVASIASYIPSIINTEKCVRRLTKKYESFISSPAFDKMSDKYKREVLFNA